jgi:hypothetical protein
VDKLVIGFTTLPFAPWILWLSGQDEAIPPDEIAGLIVPSLVMWGIAGAVAWHAGGAAYLIESLCFALLVVPLIRWLVAPLAGLPVPRGQFVGRLIVTPVTSWGVAAILAWRFELWPFEGEAVRGERHAIAVYHVDPPEGEYEPYFIAICECDWMGDIRADAESALADARKHSPNTDSNIKRPLDPDYVPPRPG